VAFFFRDAFNEESLGEKPVPIARRMRAYREAQVGQQKE